MKVLITFRRLGNYNPSSGKEVIQDSVMLEISSSSKVLEVFNAWVKARGYQGVEKVEYLPECGTKVF